MSATQIPRRPSAPPAIPRVFGEPSAITATPTRHEDQLSSDLGPFPARGVRVEGKSRCRHDQSYAGGDAEGGCSEGD